MANTKGREKQEYVPISRGKQVHRQNTVINHIQGSSKILLEGFGKWKQPATEQEFQRRDVEESQSGARLRAKGSRETNRGRM